MLDGRVFMPALPDPGKQAAAILTVVVHVLLGMFLFYGVRWQTSPPEAVSVELVSNVEVGESSPAAAEPPPPAPAPEPEAKIEAKPAPKAEPHPVSSAKPDIALKDKEKPKDKRKEAPKEKPKEAPRSAAPPTPSYDPMQALRQESAQRERARSDASVKNAAAQEHAASARGRSAATYLGKIRDKVRGNIVVPPNVSGNPEAMFDVVQLPSGEILSVRLKKSSGNPALDAAMERAILKSSPLPKPDQADLFDRNLNLRIRPLQD